MAVTSIAGGVGGLVDAARRAGGQRALGVAAGRPAVAAEDRRAVSTTSAAMVAEGAPVALDRVAALKAAIAAGSYRADPKIIAGRMVESDMSGAGQ